MEIRSMTHPSYKIVAEVGDYETKIWAIYRFVTPMFYKNGYWIYIKCKSSESAAETALLEYIESLNPPIEKYYDKKGIEIND